MVGLKLYGPCDAGDDDCHLMVQVMESWFLADPETLQKFFGQGFRLDAKFAGGIGVETISKQRVYQLLAGATKKCKTKSAYGKGEHSFKLLALVDPDKVTKVSLWARRFVHTMEKKLDR